METWKDIEDFEGKYQVSNFGRVRNSRNQIMKQAKHYKGYLIIQLYKHGKPKTKAIHRLVANAFINNPKNKPQINHKDGNKQNNNVSNLEWCTQSENNLHAYKTGLKKITDKNRRASRENIQIARAYNHKIPDTKERR